MNVFISQEVMGAAALAVVGLIMSILYMLRQMFQHVGGFADALEANHKVNRDLNLDLVAERKEAREERQKHNEDRDLWQKDRESLRADIARSRADHEQVCNQIMAEMVKVKADLNSAHNKITHLERAGEEKDLKIAHLEAESKLKDDRIEQLKTRVDSLEKEGHVKDQKIADLHIALDQSEKDKRELAAALPPDDKESSQPDDHAVDEIIAVVIPDHNVQIEQENK